MAKFARLGLLLIGVLVAASFASENVDQSCRVLPTNLSGTYEGGCKDGLAEGSGTAAGKDTYWGEFSAGLPHGQGVYVTSAGSRYEGKIQQGKPHGRGSYIFSSGHRYEGEFVDGKRHGKGTYIWPKGHRYEGEFVENQRTGKGRSRLTDGTIYDGDFVDGKYHGQGTLRLPDGRVIEGGFIEGKLVRRESVGATLSPDVTRQAPASRDTLKDVVDAIAPPDPVTGARSLNLESEEAEVRRATAQTRQLLQQARQQGHAVDTDQATLQRLQSVMNRLAQVSHRPNLPWHVHLIESPEDNAGTFGGGKIIFWRGLFGGLINPDDENEIAAVMAHEMAHITSRHAGEKQGQKLARAFSRSRRGELYQASFTTVQEAEADKVSLLYLALAGFDPRAAPKIWQRAHRRQGSTPGNYFYDHPLNVERAQTLSRLVPIALRYYQGQGVTNQDYARIRMNNDLIPRTSSSDSGLLALLEAALGVYTDHLQAKTETLSRQIRVQDPGSNARIINFNVGSGRSGQRAIFGRIQNIGPGFLRGAEITVNYFDGTGRLIYSQPQTLSNLNIRSGDVRDWSVPLTSLRGMQQVSAQVTRVDVVPVKPSR